MFVHTAMTISRSIRSKKNIVFFICLFSLAVFVCFDYVYHSPKPYLYFSSYNSTNLRRQVVPDVLKCMTSGTWRTRNLTSQEQREINAFYKSTRGKMPGATDYQRPDLKCGNVIYMTYFRVLCSPGGRTPCCFNNKCVNKTVEECRGPSNFDLRSRIHAEYATWVPSDKRCSVKFFDSQSGCSVLEGWTIYVVGDSLMRQLYTALLLILTGNYKTGALKPNTPKKMKQQCSGMYVFPQKACRPYIDFKPKLCNGNNVTLQFINFASSLHGPYLFATARRLKRKKKSMMLVGVGLWDHYVYDTVVSKYVNPMLEGLRGNYSEWPKVLWTSTHSLGIWRYPNVETIDNDHGKLYNDKMAAYLRVYDIPVFDTFSLTDGVMSIDGNHFGMGVNMLKAQIYLNYMKQLKDKGPW